MIHSVLTEYGVPFYAQLNDDEKVTFQKRVRDFLKGRQLKPRKMDQVELEHQVLISASAVTVTFGVKKFYFPYFNLVVVYPDGYEQLIKKRYQKDRVKMQGAVVLGLEELIAASKDPVSNFHPGIHEFVNALYHENVVEKEGYFDFDESVTQKMMGKYGEQLADIDYFPALIAEKTIMHEQQFFASAATLYFTQSATLDATMPALSEWLAEIFQLKIKAS